MKATTLAFSAVGTVAPAIVSGLIFGFDAKVNPSDPRYAIALGGALLVGVLVGVASVSLDRR
jgi:hypothetical protein